MSRSKGIVFFNEYQFNNLILSWQFKIYGKVLIKGTVTGFTIFIYNKTMQLNTSLFNEIIIYFTCWEYANVKNVPHVFILKIKKRVSIKDKHIFFYWYRFYANSVFIFILAISKVMQISVHYIKVVHRPLGRCISGLILFSMFFSCSVRWE